MGSFKMLAKWVEKGMVWNMTCSQSSMTKEGGKGLMRGGGRGDEGRMKN